MNIYGTIRTDGSIDAWPESDIYGQPYNRPPAATYRVGNRFVVLPAGFNDPEALSRLSKPPTPRVTKPVKSDDDED